MYIYDQDEGGFDLILKGYCLPICVLCVSSHIWTFSILYWSILINHHHHHQMSVAIQLRGSESLGRRSRHWDSWLAVQLTTINVDHDEDEDGAHGGHDDAQYHDGKDDDDDQLSSS